MITFYGLKSCDTCKKAAKWLKDSGLEFLVVDVRADGVERSRIEAWVDAVGWETVLNRRSTTWRGLGDADKEGVDAAKAVSLLAENPTLIKRPVFEKGDQVCVGFSDAVKSALI